jgi:hypothetical protein
MASDREKPRGFLPLAVSWTKIMTIVLVVAVAKLRKVGMRGQDAILCGQNLNGETGATS